VVPYDLDEVLTTLNRVHAHDWAGFFRARVDALEPRAPLRGIELSGWRLVYRDTASTYLRKLEQATREIDHSFSLGLVLHEDGGVIDVLAGSPAGRAGIAPAATVVAVGGRRFSREVLSAALAATRSTPDLDLLIENQDMFRTVKVIYKGGPRFPTLERILAEPDLLATSWARRSGAPRGP
jgi:predicted metalloprotease with PDZ domain